MNGIWGKTAVTCLPLAEGVFSSINWLWIGASVVAVWFLISGMSRRHIRLTTLLRDHVKKKNDEMAPPDTEE
ncbi:hypothetical protein SAMN06265222_104139 [Neorhodopirellula lusitana]|uniref:Heme exporter protein D n=1 Tax=Neorhodopirellula lusitana TaxID=445327 RepID=A0ABY1Q0P9_9BACT|nr:hypothetical protein [Neorhodopirellula lusitana]SMP53710.1 hypothetical protein SAMN06265222_104139 [Neorhodopirellula lusitana]